MNVVDLKSGSAEPGAAWRPADLNRLVETFAGELASGQASGWAVGETEAGDAQFYLLGPPPDQDCILCISRLGRQYVLEDGEGHVLFEHDSLMTMAERAGRLLRGGKSAIAARVVMAWCAFRHFVQEKLEPVMVEVEEALTHVAPQLVAIV